MSRGIKQVLIALAALVLLGLVYSYVSGARLDALEAEARVRVLEAERIELERQVEEAAQGYEALLDSLSQAHDSLAQVRAEAVETASDASRSFTRNIGVLRDSLQSYDGLEELLDQVQGEHEEEVAEYQVQSQTL